MQIPVKHFRKIGLNCSGSLIRLHMGCINRLHKQRARGSFRENDTKRGIWRKDGCHEPVCMLKSNLIIVYFRQLEFLIQYWK